MDKNLKIKKDLIKITKKYNLKLNNLKKFDSIQSAELIIILENHYNKNFDFTDLTSIEKIIKKIK